MELYALMKTINERKSTVLITFLSVVALALTLTNITTPTYESTARIFVTPTAAAKDDPNGAWVRFVQDQTKSYPGIATSPKVLSAAISDLNLKTNPGDLSKKLSVTLMTDTMWLDIQARDSSPTVAAEIAQKVSAHFMSEVSDINKQAGLPSLVRLTMIGEPKPSAAPSNPQPRLNLLAGGLLGLVAGISFAIIRDRLDKTVRSSRQAKQRLADDYIGRRRRLRPLARRFTSGLAKDQKPSQLPT